MYILYTIIILVHDQEITVCGHTHTLHIGCGSLTVPNGDVIYSERFRVGSTATHSCDEGYMLQDPSNTVRTCGMTDGWSTPAITCQS